MKKIKMMRDNKPDKEYADKSVLPQALAKLPSGQNTFGIGIQQSYSIITPHYYKNKAPDTWSGAF